MGTPLLDITKNLKKFSQKNIIGMKRYDRKFPEILFGEFSMFVGSEKKIDGLKLSWNTNFTGKIAKKSF